MGLQDTPRGGRLHIGLYGKRNSGKSSLVNALTGQHTAMVSSVAGTTTDPVYKAMEIKGIGPVVFVDTAGFDDVGELGRLRVDRTKDVARETDIAIVLFRNADMVAELDWMKRFKEQNTPAIPVISRVDTLGDNGKALARMVQQKTGDMPIRVSAMSGRGLAELREELIRHLPEDFQQGSITGGLARPGDTVLLVMPQDIQAPKGRLILPQVQTLRELLDKHCTAICCTAAEYTQTLASLREPPRLIITDSQVFREVHKSKPKESLLTSFSVLFAGYKGDIDYFKQSAVRLGELGEDAHILIAEACTHKPLEEDIGRVQLPRLLRQRLGEGLSIDTVAGRDFPKDLKGYDMVIHCGACMFNRKYVLSRVAACRAQKVPMTNYGVAIAYLTGILDEVELPRTEGEESIVKSDRRGVTI